MLPGDGAKVRVFTPLRMSTVFDLSYPSASCCRALRCEL